MKTDTKKPAATKKPTKTEVKPPTPKQAHIKIQTLLKGIDNSTAAVDKHQTIVKKNTDDIKKLVSGLEVQAPKAAPAVKAAPVAKTPAAKKVAPVAVKAAKKAAPAAKKAVAAKNGAAKSNENRPPLKDVLRGFINDAGAGVSAADLYNRSKDFAAKNQAEEWSRQSVYNALKDAKTFTKKGNEYVNAGSNSSASPKVSDDEAEQFVEKAASQNETSTLV